MPRFRPRFSLLSALLLTTIVGMAIVIVQFWREISPLRADNKRLNEERGTLVIGDPYKLHAIKIPARFAGEARDSFRVHVPLGTQYFAFVQVNNIPKSSLPASTKLPYHAGILGGSQGRLFARLEPGEHTVIVRTVRRGDRADIQVVVAFASPAVSLDVSANTSKDQWPTVVPETYSVFGEGVQGRTIAAEGAEPLVLLRRRIQGVVNENVIVSYVTPESDSPLNGLLLWLERSPR